jgi:hypothetical protein
LQCVFRVGVISQDAAGDPEKPLIVSLYDEPDGVTVLSARTP